MWGLCLYSIRSQQLLEAGTLCNQYDLRHKVRGRDLKIEWVHLHTDLTLPQIHNLSVWNAINALYACFTWSFLLYAVQWFFHDEVRGALL
jgi:hypothetical protein